jgi:hypothetical protein
MPISYKDNPDYFIVNVNLNNVHNLINPKVSKTE